MKFSKREKNFLIMGLERLISEHTRACLLAERVEEKIEHPVDVVSGPIFSEIKELNKLHKRLTKRK